MSIRNGQLSPTPSSRFFRYTHHQLQTPIAHRQSPKIMLIQARERRPRRIKHNNLVTNVHQAITHRDISYHPITPPRAHTASTSSCTDTAAHSTHSGVVRPHEHGKARLRAAQTLSTQPASLHVFIAVRSILDLPQVILVRARWGLHGTRTASHDGCIWSTVRRRERRPHDQQRKNHRRKRSRSRIQHALTSCGHIIVSLHGETRAHPRLQAQPRRSGGNIRQLPVHVKRRFRRSHTARSQRTTPRRRPARGRTFPSIKVIP